jgi:hypothetical protein
MRSTQQVKPSVFRFGRDMTDPLVRKSLRAWRVVSGTTKDLVIDLHGNCPGILYLTDMKLL